MPPTLQINDTDQEELLALSDEDVSLLYNIVLRAQHQDEFKTRPKKAVFDAYDAIFAEHGLHTNHDRACLRLLFQLLGPDADPQASLYEKFERLLARAGIALDHGDEDVSPAPTQGPMPQETKANDEDAGGLAWQPSPNRPERRNSFTSMYDVTAEIERLSKARPTSRASASNMQAEKSSFRWGLASEMGTQGPPRTRSYSTDDYSLPYNKAVEGRKLNGHEKKRKGAVKRYSGDHLAQEQPYLYGERDESKRLGSDLDKSLRAHAHALQLKPVSQTQLVRDSGAFDQVRIGILAKKYFRKWFSQTIARTAKWVELETDAVQRDRYMLQRQAFDSWLAAYRRIQQEELVKQHFNLLDRRAADVYDGFLKAKAFRHWCSMTIEAKANTEAARQNYLYIKYFNAWRQLTVTNELKADRQSLKAPFHLLRRRAAQYDQDEVKAVEACYSNLTKMIFWRWAFAYAGRKALKFRDIVLVRRTLLAWRDRLKKCEVQERQATQFYNSNALRETLQAWSIQTRVDRARDGLADALRNHSLTKRTLLEWHVATRLAPLEVKVARLRDWRMARSNFSVWLLRTRMIFRADWVNTFRTRQNAFTAWNERLRRDAVQARIDNRVLAQAMYKWVIAQRSILMTRIRQESEKRTTFTKLLTGYRRHRDVVRAGEMQVKNQRFARSAKSMLECWKLQMNLARARSQMAVEFSTPKIQQDMLVAWRDRHGHVQKLEKWAKDANFYFTTMKLLKRWRDAALEAKKKRTNDAYKRIRRQIKVNLARKALLKWRDRLKGMNSLDDSCEGWRRSKDADVLRGLVSHWKSQSSQRQRAVADASTRFDGQLLSHALQLWSDASRQATNLQIRADQFYHIHLSEVCSANLRRLSMKAFGIKRRQQDADAMRERHWNRHVRNIVKHWAGQLRDAAYQALLHGSSEPTDAGYGTASQDDPLGSGASGTLATRAPSATQRAEDWTAFDADLLDTDDWAPPLDAHELVVQATSTPLPTPAYLNTPSKRAARAKALAKMSTTPATPLNMPFSARLRAGIASSPIPVAGLSTVKKDGVGRSGLGVTVRPAGSIRDERSHDNR